MENQEVNQGGNESPSIEFLSDDQVPNIQPEQAEFAPPSEDVIDLDAAISQDQDQAPVESENVDSATADQETENYRVEQQYDNVADQLEAEVLEYLSDRLGRDVSSFDMLDQQQQQEAVLDERLSAIADFVEETGRDPQDWFIYQQLNPENMDDATAVKFQMAADYPDLNQEDLDLLLGSKYKLDPNLHTEEEVRLSELQLRMDAQQARNGINELRQRYQAPEVQQSEDYESPFDDQWYSNMEYETNNLDGVEFDLGNGKSFTFGLNDQYRGELMEKNARLDEYFDPYVSEDGSWDYDKLNVHRAVIDNMEQIVQSIYKQGMADGQRGIVNRAANVQAQTPNQGGAPRQGESSLAAQLRQALRG